MLEENKKKRFISLLSDTTFKHLFKIEDYKEFFNVIIKSIIDMDINDFIYAKNSLLYMLASFLLFGYISSIKFWNPILFVGLLLASAFYCLFYIYTMFVNAYLLGTIAPPHEA